ncbi:MAG: hypothetical protein BWY76_00680 [bacterium ADurb.Bin429]|nr:MAG: hypothetical protein BWY76_00680 [bacterium ADurb.Bin429]
MPPPMPGVSWPLEITGATLKPLSASRGPTVSLNEKVSPGSNMRPCIARAAVSTLLARLRLLVAYEVV